MSVLLDAKIRGISEVKGVKRHDGESERVKGEVFEIR